MINKKTIIDNSKTLFYALLIALLIRSILLHGSDYGLRFCRSQQLATLYSDDLDDVFSVTRISGASLTGEPGKIADAAAEISMSGIRLVLVKANGTELLEACKLLLAKPVYNAMVIIDASDTTTKHAVVKLLPQLQGFGKC